MESELRQRRRRQARPHARGRTRCPKETHDRRPEGPGDLRGQPVLRAAPRARYSNWASTTSSAPPAGRRVRAVLQRARNTSPTISTIYESTWVPRGFAVVHSESPGSGYSDGCPTSGGTNETLGAKAVIDWLNGRAKAYTTRDRHRRGRRPPGTTGKVGMMGTSYNGTIPRPPPPPASRASRRSSRSRRSPTGTTTTAPTAWCARRTPRRRHRHQLLPRRGPRRARRRRLLAQRREPRARALICRPRDRRHRRSRRIATRATAAPSGTSATT